MSHPNPCSTPDTTSGRRVRTAPVLRTYTLVAYRHPLLIAGGTAETVTLMKVLQLANNNPPFHTQQVEGLRDRGVDLDVLMVGGSFDIGDEAEQRRSPWDYLRFYPRVLRHVLQGYDLVHANYGLTAPFALAQPVRTPVVLTLWGSDLEHWPRLSTLCSRLSNRVIVMNDEMVSRVPGESVVIPFGVDLDLFEPIDRQAARERLGWKTDDYHALFPYAKSRPVKNYPLAERVVKQANDVVDGRIHLHAINDVAHDEMPYYYNASNVLLLTSHNEGSPTSVKEAMACNLPIVSLDVGDVRKRLSAVDGSFVCEDESQLVEKTVETVRDYDRTAGRSHADEFSFENSIGEILEVYRSVA